MECWDAPMISGYGNCGAGFVNSLDDIPVSLECCKLSSAPLRKFCFMINCRTVKKSVFAKLYKSLYCIISR